MWTIEVQDDADFSFYLCRELTWLQAQQRAKLHKRRFPKDELWFVSGKKRVRY